MEIDMIEAEEAEKWEYDETEEPEEEEQDLISYEISYYPSDLTLKGYLDKWESGQLKIPPFQRNYIWDQVQASKLIESFLLGLPVPGVFLYKERKTNKLLIIDGQQRILTAIQYFKNRFSEKIFRLKNINDKWNGRTYEELEESDRFQLDDTVLRATVVQQLDPEDDSSIYHIFERLNTGGMKLNSMEVRRCVYFSPYFNMLEELNKNPHWRQIIGKSKPDKRFRDAELILRVLSLLNNWKNYEKPMKGFLNNFLSSKMKIKEDELSCEIKSTKQEFSDVCQFISNSLPDKPFHLRGRINYAVLDSVMVSTFELSEHDEDDFNRRFAELLTDKEFIDKSTRNTSDGITLKDRFKIARKTLLDKE